jgi:putative transposase
VCTDRLRTRGEQIPHEGCGGVGTELRERTGETDHVHPLVRSPPSFTLSTLVNSLQRRLPRRLRQHFPVPVRRCLPGPALLPPTYFAGSCSGALLSITKEYLDQHKRPA